jgi:hypothetical protein
MPPISRPNRIRRYGVAATAVAVLVLCIGFLAKQGLESNRFRGLLAEEFAVRTGGHLSYARSAFRWLPRPGLWLYDVDAHIPPHADAAVARVGLFPALRPLLQGEVRLSGIRIESPRIGIGLAGLPVFSAGGEHGGALQEEPPAAALAWFTGLSQAVGTLPRMEVKVADATVDIRTIDGPSLVLSSLSADGRRSGEGASVTMTAESRVWEKARLSFRMDSRQGTAAVHAAVDGALPAAFQDLPFVPKGLRIQGAPVDLEAELNGRVDDSIVLGLRAHAPEILLENPTGRQRLGEGRLEGNVRIGPSATSLHLTELRFAHPRLALSGEYTDGGAGSGPRLRIDGRQIDGAAARHAALFLLGRHPVARGIFEVIRGGVISNVSFEVEAPDTAGLDRFRRMRISGRIDDGSIFVPGADLDLTAVHGEVRVENGILEATRVRAAHGASTGREGRLRLDLDHPRVPVQLSLPITADLSQLPPVLHRVVPHPGLRREIESVDQVKGRAEGRLVLDSWNGPMRVEVEVADFDLSGRYARVPYPIEIRSGRFRYDEDGIGVSVDHGGIGGSEFQDVRASFSLAPPHRLDLEGGAGTVVLDQLAPWLLGYPSVRTAVGGETRVTGGILLEGFGFEGPLDRPGKGSYHLSGALQDVHVEGSVLPWPVSARKASVEVTPHSAVLTRSAVGFLDAEATGGMEISLGAGGIRMRRLEFDGRLGPSSLRWTMGALGLPDAYRPSVPLRIQGGKMAWEGSGSLSVSGTMAVPEGTRVGLTAAVSEGALDISRLTVSDPDSEASIAFERSRDRVAGSFRGRLDGRSLQRLFQRRDLPEGFLSGDLSASIQLDALHRSWITGRLQGGRIVLPYLLPAGTTVEALDMTATGGRLVLSPLTYRTGGRENVWAGEILAGTDGLEVDLLWDADAIPEAPAAQDDSLSAGAFWRDRLPIAGTVRAHFDRYRTGDWTWSPLEATLRFQPGGYTVDIEEAVHCGIRTSGTLVDQDATWRLSLTPEATDRDLAATIACLSRGGAAIDGRFSFRGELTADRPDAVLTRLKGPVHLTAEDGRIRRLNLLSKILAVVNLTEVFRGRKPDLREAGFAYDSLTIDGTVEDGALHIEAATIDGSTMDLAASGTVDLASGETDLTVLVSPFKTANAIIRGTPIVSEIMGGRLISIPVKVNGSIEDPTIIPLEPGAVGSSLLDVMRRAFGVPNRSQAPPEAPPPTRERQ